MLLPTLNGVGNTCKGNTFLYKSQGVSKINFQKINKEFKMTIVAAIKRFVEDHPLAHPVTTGELMEFKKACSEEEWLKFGEDAAEALGSTLDVKDSKPVAKTASIKVVGGSALASEKEKVERSKAKKVEAA